MFNEIKNIDFDIALLSCGSYAMYFGKHIKEKLNKKSIYIGGILNVLFNIYGKRYDTAYFNSIVNLEYRIEAFESKKYPIKNTTFAGEAFNAYF